jgi:hypothetical protein
MSYQLSAVSLMPFVLRLVPKLLLGNGIFPPKLCLDTALID